MPAKIPRKLLVTVVALALVASAVTVSSVVAQQGQQAQPTDPQQTTYLRAVHASPDAPAVDVTVDNQTVLTDVSFSDVSDYLNLTPGVHNVTITAADDPNTTVFDGKVTLEPRSASTLVASGEISENASTTFEPVLYDDSAVMPHANQTAIRVVHLSPDAPTVDITAENGTVVIADDVDFQNSSDYVTVPAGTYTVEIREATETNDGPVVTTVDVTLEEQTAYSAMAVGYLNPDDAPADTSFSVVLTEDVTWSVHLPSEDTPPANGNGGNGSDGGNGNGNGSGTDGSA